MATESTRRTKRTSERVVQLKKNFIELHEQGFTIPEIADKFHLGKSTVYRLLGEIAQENGVSRDSLLQEVHETPASWVRKINLLKVNGDELLAKFDSAHHLMSEILADVKTLISIIEEDLEKYENTYI